jgi:hypothetical protein
MALAKPRDPCNPFILGNGQETLFSVWPWRNVSLLCYLFCWRYHDIILVCSGVLVQIEQLEYEVLFFFMQTIMRTLDFGQWRVLFDPRSKQHFTARCRSSCLFSENQSCIALMWFFTEILLNEAGELMITAALVLYEHKVSRDRNAIMCTQGIF